MFKRMFLAAWMLYVAGLGLPLWLLCDLPFTAASVICISGIALLCAAIYTAGIWWLPRTFAFDMLVLGTVLLVLLVAVICRLV